MFGDFEIIFVIFLGAAFGSFITAASWRLPRDEDLIASSSKCPKCSTPLKLPDLIPIFSWIFSGGKCRYCDCRIGLRYILTEIVTIAVFILHYKLFGFGVEFAIFTTMAVALLILIISDFETYIIPDTTIILLLISGLAAAMFFEKDYLDLILGLSIGAFVSIGLRQIFIWLLKKDPLGFGDIKLMAMAGLWLGSWLMPFYFALSGLIGVVTGIAWQKIFKKEEFPFGPALAISLYVLVILVEIYGQPMLLK